MDEQRRAAALQHLQHRAEALEAGRPAERVGRHARARESPVEEPRQRRGIGVGQPDRGPRAEPGGQRGDPVVVGGEQRLGLAGRERLDAERRRERDERAVDAVGVHERRAPLGVVVREVERRLGLAVQAQRSSPVARRTMLGGSRRRESSRSSGSGQRCWWMSMRGDMGRTGR